MEQELGTGPDPVSIALEGWNEGFEKIKFIKFLQQNTALDLRAAKYATDDLVNGISFQVDVAAADAGGFISQAERLGVRGIQIV